MITAAMIIITVTDNLNDDRIIIKLLIRGMILILLAV